MPDPEDPFPDQSLTPEDGEIPGKPEQGPYSVLSTQYSVPGASRSALLFGSDHTELGQVKIETITPNLAIGISRGRFPKGYAHVDPNEDAVFAATDGTTTILVVADGHHGFDAAEAAIGSISESIRLVVDRSIEGIVRDLAMIALEAVARTIPSLPQPRDTSRTALTLCAIRGHTIAVATLGDTTCYLSTKRRTTRIGDNTPFLSPVTDLGALRIDTASIPAKGIVVVASDGLADFVGSVDRSLRTASKQAPEEAVDALIADAFAGGAGDNIAVAVFGANT